MSDLMFGVTVIVSTLIGAGLVVLALDVVMERRARRRAERRLAGRWGRS